MKSYASTKDSACSELMLQMFIYVARLYENFAFNEVEEIGLTLAQAERLKAMTTLDLHDLASSCPAAGVKLLMRREMMDRLLDMLDRKKKEDQQVIKFIKAGASCQDMRQLFGLSKPEFTQKRKSLNMSEYGVGRVDYPDHASETKIWNAWCKNAHLDLRERLLKVHKETGIAIRLVRESLNNCEEAKVPA
jgi:hypothetical protein